MYEKRRIEKKKERDKREQKYKQGNKIGRER